LIDSRARKLIFSARLGRVVSLGQRATVLAVRLLRPAGAGPQKQEGESSSPSFSFSNQLFMRVLDGCLRMLVRGSALLLCSISVGFGFLMVTFIVLSDCLEMVIGRGDVTGCGKMMVLARRMALGVRHDALLPISENG
jgi:hypothetical protein